MIVGLLPRDKRVLVFGVHTNAFTGNIKAILLHENGSEYRKIFIGKHKHIVQIAHKLGIESYWKYSLKGIIYSLRAGTYVYSSYPSDINFWFSSGAKYINVWHGTPLKKIERDVTTGYYALRNKYKFLYTLIAPYLFVKPDILFVASDYEKRCFKSAFEVKDEVLFPLFPPRLKQFVSNSININSKLHKILYAPTWRDDHSFILEEHIDFHRMNEFLTKINSMLYIKMHPSDNMVFNGVWSNIVVVHSEEDIYMLMSDCDTLITDYSSMLFEYLYINRNVVLFCPDHANYQTMSREFYFDICNEPLVDVALDFGTLLEVLEFNANKPTPKLKEEYRAYAIEDEIIIQIMQKLYG